MSFRSGANTDLVLRNLRLTGKLTLDNELDINNLEVTGTASVNKLEADTLDVSGNTTLSTLDVSGETVLNELEVLNDTSLNTLSVNGTTNLNGTTYATALKVVSNLTVDSEMDIYGNIVAGGSATITPQQLGYVSGATSNIQSQINAKANLASPSFTGTVGLPTTKTAGYAYIGNDGTNLPTNNLSNYFGAIGSNMTNGHGELDFINTGYNEASTTTSAFDWYMMTSATAKTLLMRMYHSGQLWVSGLVNAVGGITTTTLTATGHSQLADVSSTSLTVSGHTQLADVSTNAMTVTGNLNVTGQITSATPGNMEILTYQLTGNASTVSQTMTLLHNTTNTTNYAVFPSVYYGYGGSGGTYSSSATAGTITPIVWTTRTASSFGWTMSKGMGDNINVYIVFLVVYNVSNSSFPSSY